jgi:hypothetical protein
VAGWVPGVRRGSPRPGLPGVLQHAGSRAWGWKRGRYGRAVPRVPRESKVTAEGAGVICTVLAARRARRARGSRQIPTRPPRAPCARSRHVSPWGSWRVHPRFEQGPAPPGHECQGEPPAGGEGKPPPWVRLLRGATRTPLRSRTRDDDDEGRGAGPVGLPAPSERAQGGAQAPRDARAPCEGHEGDRGESAQGRAIGEAAPSPQDERAAPRGPSGGAAAWRATSGRPRRRAGRGRQGAYTVNGADDASRHPSQKPPTLRARRFLRTAEGEPGAEVAGRNAPGAAVAYAARARRREEGLGRSHEDETRRPKPTPRWTRSEGGGNLVFSRGGKG